jgi:hypothetical protein
LRAAGVHVDQVRYDGMIHGFCDMVTMSTAAADAVADVNARFKALLGGQQASARPGRRGIEHDTKVRHLVRTQQVGAAQHREDGIEALGLAELVAEEVEGVWGHVADRHPERAQPEGLRQHPHLVLRAGARCVEVA